MRACWASFIRKKKSQRPRLQRHRRQPRKRVEVHGNADYSFGAADCDSPRGIAAASVYLVVARDCALLPAENAGSRRASFAAGVLAGNRLGIRHIFPLLWRTKPAALSGLFLP